MPTVLIVDDHAPFRRSVAALLAADGFDVIGEAADAAGALAATELLHPDVVLVDVQLPGRDGFAIAEELAGRPDPPVVVLVSSRDAASYASRLAAAPVRGFIAKAEMSGAALLAVLG